MRILITNDDGILAEGLAVLRGIAEALTDDVWVAAPEREHSGASRKLTFTDPVRVRQLEPKVYAVDGTPTDCVMLAVQELMDAPPDLVLSGVNRGQNLAEDTSLSGTVAGALQGMALGIPSIALSQALRDYSHGATTSFASAERHGPGLVSRLYELGWPAGVVLNVNFPWTDADAETAVEVTRQGSRDAHNLRFERRKDLRGRDYFWLGYEGRLSNPAPGTDLHAVYHGRISVTPLHIDLTHGETVGALKGVLGGAPPVLRSRPDDA